MRKWILLAALTAGVLSMGSLAPNRADAMTIGAPAGLAVAAGQADLAQDVAYVCRRAWRCGPYGCGWRRVCGWTGPRYYGYYGRPGWGHRHWHHRRW